MAVDLNKVAQKLKQQRSLGVSKDAQITDKDPVNDGSQENANNSTMRPKRFFTI